ncbi:hypothetical protein Esi_0000_0142 [Ectocarpus siliculosus]|uniref:Uncharacterized protein n=1 Tax=Ectocarpus siliculosus TaxID=2880 RepID=D8LB09_ECTSI|nr:hypothetical protein Esi_0000_0142 [Ectocarpus siliculosus]|eukprot:CBN76518.1 hypothetical protein Esi_0000_0142 [Ectocarpus siliculosus]
MAGPWHLQLEHHLGTPGYNHASHAINSSGREVDGDEQPQLLELEAGGLQLGRRVRHLQGSQSEPEQWV